MTKCISCKKEKETITKIAKLDLKGAKTEKYQICKKCYNDINKITANIF